MLLITPPTTSQIEKENKTKQGEIEATMLKEN
jgi:hypothetical protein